MDIVKADIEKLRGTIQVQTQKSKGTEFRLKIPMTLNIISLLLIRIASQTVAIPSEYVKRIIRLGDYPVNNNQEIVLDETLIPFKSLYEILPYNDDRQEISEPYIGLLMEIAGKKILLTVDAVIDEKPLVTKNFDDLVTIPPYIAGCTILGNGKVVPIFIPDYFQPLIISSNQPMEEKNKATDLKTKEKLSILVIDDSIAVRHTLDRILTQYGHQVTQCRDGKDAWNTMENSNLSFDLAFCDLEMPGFDGYQLLQLIRVSEKWHKLPVIILTSRANDLHRQKAFDLGATDYMTKPFHPSDIINKLDLIEN